MTAYLGDATPVTASPPELDVHHSVGLHFLDGRLRNKGASATVARRRLMDAARAVRAGKPAAPGRDRQ